MLQVQTVRINNLSNQGVVVNKYLKIKKWLMEKLRYSDKFPPTKRSLWQAEIQTTNSLCLQR
jgi:hypothetical protein